MKISLNGAPTEVDDGLTLAELLERNQIEPTRPGIAAAINDEIVSRAEWSRRVVVDADRIDVIAAVQGG